MKAWQDGMKKGDINGDGTLSFLEFQDAIKIAENNLIADLKQKSK